MVIDIVRIGISRKSGDMKSSQVASGNDDKKREKKKIGKKKGSGKPLPFHPFDL
jgi:hypothetical protein